ncbi:hypothetical protein [Brachybacterium sp. GPGPB12]|uniref:hypothetical protein n=1 Tax=Brachybacterium sp. GPGPB12 TaxID=3023517 RepID=UPI0031345680
MLRDVLARPVQQRTLGDVAEPPRQKGEVAMSDEGDADEIVLGVEEPEELEAPFVAPHPRPRGRLLVSRER